MTPEEYIARFLQVLENQPDVFLSYSDAIEKLETINEIAKSENASNQQVAEAILYWSEGYPDIQTALETERKFTPKPVDPAQQEGMLKNRWPLPLLVENLENRLDNSQTPVAQNDS